MGISRASTVAGRYYHRTADGRLECDLCPRHCRLRDSQRGFCFVRARRGDEIVLVEYGRSSGFGVDPIEKKPLFHFLPGSPILSFGALGCNLACRFCQNWHISRGRDTAALLESATPESIARTAVSLGCSSVAFTYNEPVISLEYAVDVARACHDQGVRAVAVTSGYVEAGARADFFREMDAANVDLKSFRESFYVDVCGGHLRPVLDTLRFLAGETDVWLEVTTLLIPGLNDGDDELDALSRFVVTELGADVPLHFTAFHPDARMRDRPPTPPETLRHARDVARSNGAHHVYVGNVRDPAGEATVCPGCGTVLVGRDRYAITEWRVEPDGRCPRCGRLLAGVFEDRPGRWGLRRAG